MNSYQETLEIAIFLQFRKFDYSKFCGCKCIHMGVSGTIMEYKNYRYIVKFDSDFRSSTGQSIRMAKIIWPDQIEFDANLRKQIEETPLDKEAVRSDQKRISADYYNSMLILEEPNSSPIRGESYEDQWFDDSYEDYNLSLAEDAHYESMRDDYNCKVDSIIGGFRLLGNKC